MYHLFQTIYIVYLQKFNNLTADKFTNLGEEIMKKRIIILSLIILMSLFSSVKADEWGWDSNSGFYHRESPMDVIIESLPIIIIGIFLIIILAVVISLTNKSKTNPPQNIQPSFQPISNNSPSQYAFWEKKSYCPKCGRSINNEYQICPYCGDAKGDK